MGAGQIHDEQEEPMTIAAQGVPVTEQTVRVNAESTRTFTGVLLGSGSSRRDAHNHPPDEPVPKGVRCSGCRWSEIKIFWSHDDNQYVVSMVGRSAVPSEVDRVKIAWVQSPEGVLDALLVTPARYLNPEPDQLELPPANADALETAAEVDPRLANVFDAYDAEQHPRD